jgi:hypothetical protein
VPGWRASVTNDRHRGRRADDQPVSAGRDTRSTMKLRGGAEPPRCEQASARCKGPCWTCPSS